MVSIFMHQILGFKIEKRNIVNLKKAYFKSPSGNGWKFRERLARIKQKLEKPSKQFCLSLNIYFEKSRESRERNEIEPFAFRRTCRLALHWFTLVIPSNQHKQIGLTGLFCSSIVVVINSLSNTKSVIPIESTLGWLWGFVTPILVDAIIIQ